MVVSPHGTSKLVYGLACFPGVYSLVYRLARNTSLITCTFRVKQIHGTCNMVVLRLFRSLWLVMKAVP